MTKRKGKKAPVDDLRYISAGKLTYWRKCAKCGKLEQLGAETIALSWICLGCWLDLAMPGNLPADRSPQPLDTPAE